MISKRPMAFFGNRDKYLLRDGRKGAGSWELIGKEVTVSGEAPQRDLHMEEGASLHRTEVAYLLLTQQPQVRFTAFLKFFSEEKLLMLLKLINGAG